MAKIFKEARFYNASDFAISIIAVINEGIDWAAYIGSTTNLITSEEETIEFVAKHGCKLSKKDAIYYFPDIKLRYRP